MVRGLDIFRERFRDYSDRYVLIGGTACDLAMREAGLEFSATKDLDIVLVEVSTDAGLEQEFNSLEAQYDASQAYIRSQAHAGWTLIKARYDDGGFSGGSTDRPALQQLLADVRARKFNVIVVY